VHSRVLWKNMHYQDKGKEINTSLTDYFVRSNVSFAVLLQKILTQLYRVISPGLRSSGLATVMRN